MEVIDLTVDTSDEDDGDDEDGYEWHHPGHLDPDNAEFPDHDEACHGKIESNWCRRQYPDGYVRLNKNC